ncbi:MAG: CehA/McbA family metallohydrolase [Deltaproteobacteria bacterium]|nr:CehA/McbA family metallohydrolase [Deltaproteobacteria bacterium]
MKRLFWATPLLALSVLAATVGCSESTGSVIAKQIGSRSELIGGPGALGEVGDFLLANDQIRVIVQGPGYSRGFGVYGGGLIDADLVRPAASGDSSGGHGKDSFAEMFPAFFLKAMKPDATGISVRENDDGSASVVVRGTPGDFLFMIAKVNDLILGAEGLIFENEYRIRPGKRYIEITSSILNGSTNTVTFPDELVSVIPIGDILLFGAKSKVFAPVAGFDLRFTLVDLYKEPTELPQLPGLITPFVATKGDGVSYGFASGVTDPESSYITRARYPDAQPDELLVPFLFSGFTGAMHGALPKFIEERGRFSVKKYFIVGSGDVASIRDVVHEIQKTPVGEVSAIVRSAVTLAPESQVSVVTYDANGQPYNQHTPDSQGNFRGTYAPGSYSYRVVADGRFTSAPVPFEVKAAEKLGLEIFVDLPGQVVVRILGRDGRMMPGKCTLIGTYPMAAAGFEPMRFLYDLQAGEAMRPTDMIPDGADPKTREYQEQVIYLGAEPVVAKVRPGDYRAVCSRGIEYGLAETSIEVRAGGVAEIDVTLEHELPTEGWASGDFHLHSTNSIDSALPLDQRVTEVAAEGVDVALSSDHNFVTDYEPMIAQKGLSQFVQGMVGLELTTLEVGHFNGFPLEYEPGPITKGAFEWSGRAPRELFADLRKLGKFGPEETIVQVNHPRDTILGYLNAYNFNPDTGEPEGGGALLSPEGPEFGPERFDRQFDAIEIYNNKRFDLLRSYRVPEVLPPPPLPANIPPAGTILRDESGKIAFPGGMDDWFVLLNQGARYTAMGNSDSHGHGDDEAGYPRTYLPVSTDRPGEIDEREITRAIKSGQAVATNGPLISLRINDRGMGELVPVTGGTAKVKISATSASWVDLTTVTLIVNGETVRTIRGDRAALANIELDLPVARDAWVLVEARGEQSMWPVVTPLEIPSIQVSDAIGGIATAFGFDLNPFGNLKPQQQQLTKPYGFTNPVFLDADGDGKFSPSFPRGALRAAPPDAPRVQGKRIEVHKVPTLVKIFSVFMCHAH